MFRPAMREALSARTSKLVAASELVAAEAIEPWYQPKIDLASGAVVGFEALMKGEGDVVAGWKNKLQAAAAAVIPDSALAQMHRDMAEPGSAER